MPLHFVVHTYEGTTQQSTNSQFGPLYDCCQPQHLGMFGFSSVKNCSQSMLQQEPTVMTFREEVL